MALVNFLQNPLPAEVVRDINEMIFEEIVKTPELEAIHNIFTDVVYNKEIGFLGEGGLVGKKSTGCNPEEDDWTIPTRSVVWEPKLWAINLKECYKDLEATLAVYALHRHTAISDLEDTDYMRVIIDRLIDSIKKMYMRLIWLGDENAQNVSDGGQITDGISVDYFNVLNGLFLQLEAAITNNPELGVTIAANAQATKALQLSSLTDADAYAILSDMYYKAPVQLRASGKMQFLVTQTIADAYQKYLVGKGIESTYRNLVDGVPQLTFLGVPVIAVPVWDEMIQSYMDDGTKFINPHRAVLCERDNLAVGVNGAVRFDDILIHYDPVSKNTYLRVEDKLDTKLLNDTRLVYAQ